jgi:6,7-dimethyl-8-ribityllumazine synthase
MLSSSNFRSTDTISVVKTQWNSSLSDSLVGLRKQALKRWVELELNLDNVEVIGD